MDIHQVLTHCLALQTALGNIFFHNAILLSINSLPKYKHCARTWTWSTLAHLNDPVNWGKLKKIGFCAKGKNNEISCAGDSGGAAVWKDPKDQNRAYVLGIASTFFNCNGALPSIFTAISGKVAVWIHEKIKSTIKCQEQFRSND